jgi:hypothetical protein
MTRDSWTARDSWVESLFRPLVIGVMVGCVAWSLVQLALVFAPAWNPTYLVVGCVLAALEATFSYRLLSSPRMLGANVLRFRLAELALIFLFLKLGRYVSMSGEAVQVEIQNLPHDLTVLFDLETMAAFALALLCWSAATQTVVDLKRIADPPQRRPDYAPPVERLTGRFFSGGVVLLIATGLARLDEASKLLDLRRPSEGGLILNALVYFLLGLVMLGQARYAELRKGWQGQNAQISEKVAGRWARYSLCFIGLAALLALLLPTEFTLGLLNWMADSLGLIGSIMAYIVSLILTILLLPIGWLFWLLSLLLSIGGEQRPPPQPQLPAFEPPQRPQGEGTMSWLEIVWPFVFWAVVLGVVFYFVRSYLRDRPELQEAIRSLRPLQALRRGWTALWQWLRARIGRLRQTVSERLPRVLKRPSATGGALRSPLRFFRLGALSPRQRVLYYYLSVLRRAGQQGYPRRRHQTPQEYQAVLEPNLPQSQEEMASLTEAFVEARYSAHEIGVEQDQQVRDKWKRVKAALRALRRQEDSIR